VIDFKHKKIRLTPRRKPLSEKAKQHLLTAVGIILILVVIYLGGRALINKISNSKIFSLITGLVGQELQTDDHGNTNILMFGVGGGEHEGKDLTDTIIVASINHENSSIGMLSLPRDLYVKSTAGDMRVNKLYEAGKNKWDSMEGLNFARDTIGNILDIKLQYVVKVDFEAFTKIVDAIGGIDLYIENEINDPMYPKDGTFDYETFYIAKGFQHLDGTTALKYARSRKTSSDFDRSSRQQEVMLAIKDKIQKEQIISKRSLLREAYYSLTEHVETDMSFGEMLTFAEFGAKLDAKSVSMSTLNDEPNFKGGLLYVPVRDLYGGAYVLLPAGDNFNSLRFFARLTFYGPRDVAGIPMAIVNGTKENGLASKYKSILHRFGIATGATANARRQDLQETTWYIVAPEARPLVEFLQEILPGKISTEIPTEYKMDPKLIGSKFILEIGKDYEPTLRKLDIFKNIFLMVPPPGAAAKTTTAPGQVKPASSPTTTVK